MIVKKIVIDSDIILDHVVSERSPSLLRKIAREYFCYTTVFNAIELFSAAKTNKEVCAIEDAMSAIKVLGLNYKSAKNIAKLYSVSQQALTGLIAGVCIEAKLPIVTLMPDRYKRYRLLKVLPAHSVMKMKKYKNELIINNSVLIHKQAEH